MCVDDTAASGCLCKVTLDKISARPLKKLQIFRRERAALTQGKTIEKLGVWSEDGLIGLLAKLNPIKSVDDPELFTKNLKFEGVPVRVYQPRESSAGGRKGVMFFHGGGFKCSDLLVPYNAQISWFLAVLRSDGPPQCSDLLVPDNAQISCFLAVLRSDGPPQCSDLLVPYNAQISWFLAVLRYRLAPEHLYPAAFEDCLNATIYFLKTAQDYGVNPSSVVICGDSAGGNLTAGVAQALVTRKDIPKPLAQVLIYPVVQMIDFNLPSYQQNSGVPLLLIDKALFYMLNYLGEGVQTTLHKKVQNGSHVPPDLRKKFSKWLSADNIPDEFKVTGYKPHTMSAFDKNVYEKVKQLFEPPCSPLVAEDSVFRLLPKAYILTCEFDVLRDEGILYKKRLEDNGVSVTWHHIKDGFHGIISFCDQWDCESGKRAVDSFVSFIRDA
ncbi:PREDICTED: arylacetamide deacetylase-like 4 [Nanorana parkeri]|uniref:arylacetamide deacetylase-like 4 n=1 Tax=Nanorana parkeri TaxID=125878 RepID=UPI000854DD83|nr:PREDICTED: arylacetamide deacetylase-like 4 [Nanorana parkeri]